MAGEAALVVCPGARSRRGKGPRVSSGRGVAHSQQWAGKTRQGPLIVGLELRSLFQKMGEGGIDAISTLEEATCGAREEPELSA